LGFLADGAFRQSEVGSDTESLDPGSFSPREMDVLSLLATGIGNEQVGSQLGISLNTVKTHVRHIKEKLGTKNRAETALAAAKIIGIRSGRIRQGAVEGF